MAEQFSQEYIDYILSDEAKMLQSKWEPKIRDVFIIRDGDGAQFLVVDTLEPKHPFKHWITSYVYLSPYGPDSGELITLDMRVSDQSVWLPTLWDLLRIIKGAGYICGMQATTETYRFLVVWLHDNGATKTRGPSEKDIMLAAANLAVLTLTKGG